MLPPNDSILKGSGESAPTGDEWQRRSLYSIGIGVENQVNLMLKRQEPDKTCNKCKQNQVSYGNEEDKARPDESVETAESNQQWEQRTRQKLNARTERLALNESGNRMNDLCSMDTSPEPREVDALFLAI